MNEYQENILDHYKNPHNFGKPQNYTRSSKVQNLICGDEIEVFIEIDENILTNLWFHGEGCSISIGSSSILFEHLKGKKVSYIKGFNESKLLKFLGIKLTPSRIKCATLCIEALKTAIGK